MADEFDSVMIEDLDLWESKLFTSTYPLHEQEVTPLIASLYQLKDQQKTDIDSEVAVFAKHALFESELNLLETPQENINRLKGFIQDLVGLIAQAVNQDYWPEDAEAEVKIIES
jgi:hypothetical protein